MADAPPQPQLPPFNRGDVVILKSGGPDMTVESGNLKVVRAKWFDGPNLKSEIFLVELIKASEA